jgi:hypothetical protein
MADTEKLQAAFVELIEADPAQALQLITGMFVGLTVELVSRQGVDASRDILIDGCGRRDITIHALKS